MSLALFHKARFLGIVASSFRCKVALPQGNLTACSLSQMLAVRVFSGGLGIRNGQLALGSCRQFAKASSSQSSLCTWLYKSRAMTKQEMDGHCKLAGSRRSFRDEDLGDGSPVHKSVRCMATSSAAASDGSDDGAVLDRFKAREAVRAKKRKQDAEKGGVLSAKKLEMFRKEMEKAGVDAYVVPTGDPHQSEYSAECFGRLPFISSFTGSNGTAVITMAAAALWTDGRYFLQAEKELPAGWTLMRAGQPGVPTAGEWLCTTLPEGSRVGIDPFLHSADSANQLRDDLAPGRHILAPTYDSNLVDHVWKARSTEGAAEWWAPPPPFPRAPLRVHPLRFAGRDVAVKLADIRSQLKEAGATALLVSMLDEVAWLVNLRGGDVPHCPVTIAYVIVELERATFFVDNNKVTREVINQLVAAGIEVQAYDALLPYVKMLAQTGERLWLDSAHVSAAVCKVFEDACLAVYAEQKERAGASMQEGVDAVAPAAIYRTSPVTLPKALKNAAELEGMREAHLKDGAALAGFFTWLEAEVAAGRQPTEVEAGDALETFRAQQEGFLEPSFPTIAGSGPNGAIIHYRASPESCGRVGPDHLFLLDSGGQYEEGTTDITRTVHLGTPSEHQKVCYTRVLQGHIAIDRAVFPEGTVGFVLDALARIALWSEGLDYRHGTGHGVGAALNVHEGPQSISPRFGNTTALAPSMVLSNEPGYYEDGAFGIRIENLLVVKEAATPHRFGGVSFLGFERLTMCPIQTSLLDLSRLTGPEVDWINTYHAEVWTKVSSRVDGAARDWLHRATRPIMKPEPEHPVQVPATVTSGGV